MGLRDLLDGADAGTEGESDRDGLLSFAVEWHALTVGLAAGLLAGATGRLEVALLVAGIPLGVRAVPESVPALGQLKSEPWYAMTGVAVGLLLGSVLPV